MSMVGFSSVQFSRSVVSDSLRPHELQHARPPCPSPNPGVYSNPCPFSWWCHPAISSSVVPFSSCPQSLPGRVNSSHEVAKVLEFQLQHQSFQRTPRTDLLYGGLAGSPCSPRDSKSLLQHHSSKAAILRRSGFFSVQLSGKQWKQCQTLFLGAPKSLQMVIAAMKIKDAYSFERKVMTNLDSILKSRDSMRQALGPGALGRPRGIRWRGRWEGGSGWGTHVNPWLIHVNVWQNPLQYCIVIGLLLIKKLKKINKNKKIKSRDITLPTKVRLVKAMVFPVVMYGWQDYSCHIPTGGCLTIWLSNCCFCEWTPVLPGKRGLGRG